MTGRRFLFTMWDGGGTVPPELSVARALLARGHEVRVLADRALRDEVEAAGAEHVEWATAPQRTSADVLDCVVKEWNARTPIGSFAMLRDGLVCAPAARFAADTRAELERRPADVAVVSAMLLGTHIGAWGAGVPVAALAANVMALPGWGVPPIGPGVQPAKGVAGAVRDRALGSVMRRLFDRGLPAVNAARAEHGLTPLASVLDQFAQLERLLILTSRAFEYPQFAGPPNVRFTGPRLDDPAWATEWTPRAGDAPLVLVGLSSTYMDQAPLLQRIADALGTLPVRGIITTGPAIDPSAVDAPENVHVVSAAPHSAILREAAAVITHAGHGTIIKALAAGVPAVCVPMGRDQLDNTARAVAAGAAVGIRPGARPARIAAAVRQVLDDPSYAAGSRRLADAIAADLREDRAVAELEHLAGARDGRAVGAPA
jgi:MGT family glycosyltransferase